MRHSMAKLFVISSLLLSLAVTIWPLKVMAQEESDLGKITYEKWCAGCHGTDGKSPSSIPSLYGKSSKYIEASLIEFLHGTRKGTVMNRIAKGYSENDIKLIAKYFGKLTNN